MENIMEISNLCKSYGEFALKDVSFSLKKGFIMGFVGENGSGKTTTIRSILNMARIDSGKITVFGMDSVSDCVSIRQKLGVVFDSLYLATHLTVKQIEKQQSLSFSMSRQADWILLHVMSCLIFCPNILKMKTEEFCFQHISRQMWKE